MSDRKECGASGVHVEAPWPCERKPGHEGAHMACGTTWEDAPTAPRERETPMSARDQQVAEAMNPIHVYTSAGVHHMRPSLTNEACEREAGKLIAALLTTHRRQVLTEVREAYNAYPLTHMGFTEWLDTQLLRDTKENDK